MCKGASGVFNPGMIFNCLNDIQKEEDPKLYQPEILEIIKRKKELQAIEKEKAEKRKYF